MAMTDGMGVMPVYNLDRSNDGGIFGGSDGGGMWVFFLFFLLAWGGNGFGGFGGNGGATGMVNNDFLFTNLNQSLDRLGQSVGAGFQGVNNGICDLGYRNLANFKDLQAEISNCYCATNRNIDAVRYENAKNTCDIIRANEKNTDRIINHLTQSEIQTLRDRLQDVNMQLSQQAQTASLISTLRPFPQPAYITCSPYESAGIAPTAACGLY